MTKDPKVGIPESRKNDKDVVDRAAMDHGEIKPELAEVSATNHSDAQSSSVWMALCERAAVEKNPRKLLELISEINRLLDTRERQLSANHKTLPEKPPKS
jgi:hypothetical protein